MDQVSPYTDETFYLLVSVLIIGVAMLIQVFIWYRRWKSPVAAAMTRDQAREEFGALMSRRLGVAMEAAELDQLIIDRWDEWPVEYRPALYQVLRHTQLLEETLLEEAKEKGIYHLTRRIVTDGPPIVIDPQPSRLPPLESPAGPESESAAASEAPASNVRTLPSSRWINGQLVKTG